MSNSSLICYTKLSPNCNKPRNKKIDAIVVHHMAGNATIEACGELFARTSRQASSNYGIGTDGRIGMYVEECNRSWCSSSGAIDHRAITIEVANDGGDPDWHVSDKAFESLVALCTDICKRNGIAKLNYTGDKSGNLHMHKWYAATGCPGPYLGSKFPELAERVNANLTGTVKTEEPKIETKVTETKSKKTNEELAAEVWAGKWGNGTDRKNKLTAAGYDYNAVQALVNKGVGKNTITKTTTKSSFLPGRGYFQRGDVSDNVLSISKFMYRVFPLYTDASAVSSTYNDKLISSIKEFQRRTNLEPDGYFGPLTLAKLKEFGFSE